MSEGWPVGCGGATIGLFVAVVAVATAGEPGCQHAAEDLHVGFRGEQQFGASRGPEANTVTGRKPTHPAPDQAEPGSPETRAVSFIAVQRAPAGAQSDPRVFAPQRSQSR